MQRTRGAALALDLSYVLRFAPVRLMLLRDQLDVLGEDLFGVVGEGSFHVFAFMNHAELFFPANSISLS